MNNRYFCLENGGVQIAQGIPADDNLYRYAVVRVFLPQILLKQVGCHPMTAVTNRDVSCVRVRAYIYPRVLLPYYSGIVGNSNVLSYAHVRTCASVCTYAGRRTRESQRFLPDRCPQVKNFRFSAITIFRFF